MQNVILHIFFILVFMEEAKVRASQQRGLQAILRSGESLPVHKKQKEKVKYPTATTTSWSGKRPLKNILQSGAFQRERYRANPANGKYTRICICLWSFSSLAYAYVLKFFNIENIFILELGKKSIISSQAL